MIQRIQKLSAQVINQIAAGEVIERPASVVKELVENSVDAHAVHIEVELEEGGKRSIRVIDDGTGIVPEDLPLAFESHATSKLTVADDLQRVLTMGFRGEALASIASVADVDLVSRPPGAEVGERLEAREGRIAPGPPESMAPGTRVTVKNLFYLVPARKRFLKGERGELMRVTSTLQQIALALPNVAFTLRHEGRVVFRYPSRQDPRARVAEVLGEDCAKRLLEVESPDGRLRGWVGEPGLSRRDSRSIHVFLNGRPVRDPSILHAVRHAYQGFQIPGRYPLAVLSLAMAPDEVDVNVHPAKREVRFRDQGAVHSLVYHTVRRTLEGERSVPSLLPEGLDGKEAAAPVNPQQVDLRDSAATDQAEAGPSHADSRGAADVESRPPKRGYSEVRETISGWRALVSRDDRRPTASPPSGSPSHASPSHGRPPPGTSGEPPAARAVEASKDLIDGRELRVFQVRNSFLVVEEEDGLAIIDQHALHEKILYEEICEARERGELRQALLIPETLKLSPDQWEHFAEAGPALGELGFEVEEFGDRTVIVRAIPAGLEEVPIDKLVGEVLDRVGDRLRHGASPQVEVREHLLATIACKRAVKAGQPLPPPLQVELLKGRSRAFQPQNCPHGRPSEIFVSWADLEKRFDRR